MEDTRYFQFIAGERKGEVLVFDRIELDDDMVFICFKDGSRCNEDLILPINDKQWNGKYMAEIENTKNIWRFQEEWIGRVEERSELNGEQERVIVTPFNPGKKKIIPIPPKKVKIKSDFGVITNHEAIKTPIEKPIEKIMPDGDPVYLMVDNSKKFDTEISLDMTVSLPKQSLYSVIDESFENGGNKMINYIVNDMDINIIKEALKKSLLEAYKSDDDKYNNLTLYKPVEPQGHKTKDIEILEKQEKLK